MSTWIVWLRGINVGKERSVGMKALREALQAAGLDDVRSHIQSGNLVVVSKGRRAEIAEVVADTVEREFGFRPAVMVHSVAEVRKALANDPYPDADRRRVQLYFLEKSPSAGSTKPLEDVQVASEQFELIGRVFYLHAPEGIGRSKLAAKVERALGVATARNANTVAAVLALASVKDR